MASNHRRELMIGALLTALFCAVGIALVVWGCNEYVAARDFINRAQQADGVVVGFETYEGNSSDLRDDIHYAMVRYTPADGDEITFRGPSRDGLVRLNQGDEVGVFYRPDDPQQARVDSFMGLWFPATMLLVVGSGAIAIPLLTMWQAWKWVKRQESTAS